MKAEITIAVLIVLSLTSFTIAVIAAASETRISHPPCRGVARQNMPKWWCEKMQERLEIRKTISYRLKHYPRGNRTFMVKTA